MLNVKTTGALLLAGVAAWAIYKYNTMSSEEKSKLTSDLKDAGQKLKDQINPYLKGKLGETMG